MGCRWRVIETERTYLREMTVEDVDAPMNRHRRG